MLARQIERLQRSTRLDQLVVATSDQADDLAIAALCAELDVPCFRGPWTTCCNAFIWRRNL